MSDRLGLLLLSLLLVPQTTQLKPDRKASKTHPGTVVDAYAKTGILAKAHAYGSQHVLSQEECPVYDDSLDNQQSDPADGTFTFYIPRDKSSYLAVYCQPGYVSRTETTNDNSADRTRVRPDPVKLFPLKAKLPLDVSPSTVAFVAIASDLDGLRSNFRYYGKAAPAAFSDALKFRFSPADRDMVESIRNRPDPFLPAASLEWRPRVGELRNPDVAFVAIATDLDNARSNFVYYEQANKDAYVTARSKFPSQDQSIIDRIRERPQPVLPPNAKLPVSGLSQQSPTRH